MWDKSEFITKAWKRGRLYATSSGLTLEETLIVLAPEVKKAVKAGLTSEEVIEALTKGYKNEPLVVSVQV
jgi:hypothetical protein